jgi:predicted hydrolase (HD superfamily)
MTRDQAWEIVTTNIQNVNLRRHCLAVEAVMGALSIRLDHKDQKEKWEIAGLLHDADWEVTQNDPNKHTHMTLEWIKEIEPDEDIQNAIYTHAWGYVDGNPKPKTQMDWALYTCDELTGLIVACALVKPDRKLASVTADIVMTKWKEKSFAKGVNRDQIIQCEGSLGIPIREFVETALLAMQNIAPSLGL